MIICFLVLLEKIYTYLLTTYGAVWRKEREERMGEGEGKKGRVDNRRQFRN
jgi:hypothetical protein